MCVRVPRRPAAVISVAASVSLTVSLTVVWLGGNLVSSWRDFSSARTWSADSGLSLEG